MTESVIAFYDKHYERDSGGRLRITPAQALDTYQDAVNPLPEIAGLRLVLNEIAGQKLPVSRAISNTAKRLLLQLPVLPAATSNGKAVLLPAEQVFGASKGTENPELHAVFPFRLYGVNKPDLEVARTTFELRKFPKSGGSAQDSIQAALLGLTGAAKTLTAQNFAPATNGSRFPAFWGPDSDWTPAQEQGNVASLALQSMLMQTDGSKIVLFPAWPKEWDVEFKLHAPLSTTVEGVYKAGKVERLTVIPEKRSADVVQMKPE